MRSPDTSTTSSRELDAPTPLEPPAAVTCVPVDRRRHVRERDRRVQSRAPWVASLYRARAWIALLELDRAHRVLVRELVENASQHLALGGLLALEIVEQQFHRAV